MLGQIDVDHGLPGAIALRGQEKHGLRGQRLDEGLEAGRGQGLQVAFGLAGSARTGVCGAGGPWRFGLAGQSLLLRAGLGFQSLSTCSFFSFASSVIGNEPPGGFP